MDEIFQKWDNYKRAHLVVEDPVVCAVILYRIVTVLMCSKLCGKKKYNPFGRYALRTTSYASNSTNAAALTRTYYYG